MLGQVQSLHLLVHHLLDVGLWDTPQPGKQGQVLPTCQTINQSIKLRTIANPLLDLVGVGGLGHVTSCDITHFSEVGPDVIAGNHGRSIRHGDVSSENAKSGGFPGSVNP